MGSSLLKFRWNSAGIACLAVLALLSLFACHRWFGPDIFFHLAWGRAILESGQSLPPIPALMNGSIPANQYWLFQICLHLLYQAGGPALVTFVYVGLWLAIGALWIAT